MAGRKSMHHNHNFLLRLNDDDRRKLTEIQNKGINISDEIRRFIRDMHDKIIIQK